MSLERPRRGFLIDSDTDLIQALTESQHLGMLGARTIPDVIAHSEAFVAALTGVHGLVVDVGTGGGIPGLIVASRRPDLRLVLIDRRQTRTDHVRRLVTRLGWDDRVTVWTGDATQATEFRQMAAAVVARGFGPPRALLPVAAFLSTATGVVIVSDPPSGVGRWSPDLLIQYGFHPEARAIGAVTMITRSAESPPPRST